MGDVLHTKVVSGQLVHWMGPPSKLPDMEPWHINFQEGECVGLGCPSRVAKETRNNPYLKQYFGGKRPTSRQSEKYGGRTMDLRTARKQRIARRETDDEVIVDLDELLSIINIERKVAQARRIEAGIEVRDAGLLADQILDAMVVR